MPHRLNAFRAKIQFVTAAAMPSLITRAVAARGMRSNTQYLQHALCEALARDLGLDLDELLATLPPPRGLAAVAFGADRRPMAHTGRPDIMESVR